MANADATLAAVRSIALALPGVEERLSHGATCFYVRKRPLCYYHDADFSDAGRPSIWCPAPPGVADELATAEADRFFRPTPSASGVFAQWIGMWLDTEHDLEVAASVIDDAFRLIAPKRLVSELDAG